MLVWGSGLEIKADLPEARVINTTEWLRDAPDLEEEVEVVIVDDYERKQRPRPEMEEYLAKNRDVLSLMYKTDDEQTRFPRRTLQRTLHLEVYAREPDR
jgi:hypothetical protein